jgi:hypothetical protein
VAIADDWNATAKIDDTALARETEIGAKLERNATGWRA